MMFNLSNAPLNTCGNSLFVHLSFLRIWTRLQFVTSVFGCFSTPLAKKGFSYPSITYLVPIFFHLGGEEQDTEIVLLKYAQLNSAGKSRV